MAAEWFYTTHKQQMGPVSWKELVELAQSGILQMHDLVWTEGMEEWVKAINQQGLFDDEGSDPAEAAVTTKKKSSSQSAPKPPPGRRRSRDEDEEEEEEDPKEKKKRERRAEEARTKMSMGVKIGCTIAGVLLVLLLGVGCIGGMIWVTYYSDKPLRKENYTVSSLNEKNNNEKRFDFAKGQRVTITVTNELAQQNTDVDLRVYRGNDKNPFVADNRTPNVDPNCKVVFDVNHNDSYKVVVVNLGPGTARRCEVVIEVR